MRAAIKASRFASALELEDNFNFIQADPEDTLSSGQYPVLVQVFELFPTRKEQGLSDAASVTRTNINVRGLILSRPSFKTLWYSSPGLSCIGSPQKTHADVTGITDALSTSQLQEFSIPLTSEGRTERGMESFRVVVMFWLP